jgi:hypothetical protein
MSCFYCVKAILKRPITLTDDWVTVGLNLVLFANFRSQIIPQTAFIRQKLLLALLNSGMIRPPSPPTLGGTEPQSPPVLGDLGGAKFMGFQDSYSY